MSSVQHCLVLALTASLAMLSFQEMPKVLLCHLWWAAFSLFVSVAVKRPYVCTAEQGRQDYRFIQPHLHFQADALILPSFSFFQMQLLLSRCELWHPFYSYHYAKCSCRAQCLNLIGPDLCLAFVSRDFIKVTQSCKDSRPTTGLRPRLIFNTIFGDRGCCLIFTILFTEMKANNTKRHH